MCGALLSEDGGTMWDAPGVELLTWLQAQVFSSGQVGPTAELLLQGDVEKSMCLSLA